MSVYVGESRGELLAWLNDLLSPNVITKVEECGKGYILCQVLDSIYGDLPMTKVKMTARMEYEYLENFKILQKAFTKHRIEKPIPVEKLVKCKMQDNLEFLQWLKKFWDANSRGDEYNAAERTGGAVSGAPSASSSRAVSGSGRAPATRPAAGSGAPRVASVSVAQVQNLRAQVEEMQTTCEGLEKERDFYFAKLRTIELIVAERVNLEGIELAERDILAKIQEILYQTEDGFEVPEGDLADDVEALELGEDQDTF